VSGTTFSGWPFMTTFGNTITMLILGCLTSKRLGDKPLSVSAAGDNIVFICDPNDCEDIKNIVKTLTVSKNTRTTRGLGLIISDIAFKTGAVTYLSKIIFPSHSVSRLLDRVVETADYCYSDQAKTEEGKRIIRHSVIGTIEAGGGNCPAIPGYTDAYKALSNKAGELNHVDKTDLYYK